MNAEKAQDIPQINFSEGTEQAKSLNAQIIDVAYNYI